MTLQGRAIHEAAVRFGDGTTLPFTPCKKGYLPTNVDGQPMFACAFHHEQRRRRFMKEKQQFRNGEVDLRMFWEAPVNDTTDTAERQKLGNRGNEGWMTLTRRIRTEYDDWPMILSAPQDASRVAIPW
jgi:hypothetical protein